MTHRHHLMGSAFCLLASAAAWLAFSAGESLHADPSPPPATASPDPPPPAASETPPAPPPSPGELYELLPHDELESLNRTSRRISSMMDAILPFETTVWPHAIRDEHGRAGIFLAPPVPFSTLAASPGQDPLKGWVVCAILAVGKYAETSSVPVHHICLTDPSGMRGELWCYDIDIGTVRHLHHRLVSGTISADDAFQTLTARWKKITRAPGPDSSVPSPAS